MRRRRPHSPSPSGGRPYPRPLPTMPPVDKAPARKKRPAEEARKAIEATKRKLKSPEVGDRGRARGARRLQ